MEDDGDVKDDTKRRSRNLSEKKRRDQFNMLVHELGAMVCTNSRKMDKSSVLKSTISFLKHHNEITVKSRAHDIQEDWKPTFLSNEEFTYLMLEALEGFVMVFSSTGKIYYVSESITSLLGHIPSKVVNKSIFDFTCEEDRPSLYNLLQRNVAAIEQTEFTDEAIVVFALHIRRGALDFRDDTTYELVTFSGHFRINRDHVDGTNYQQEMGSSVLFVCTGRLQTPQLIRDVSLIDPNRLEFTSRHSLEWKFLFLDHRGPPIIGYLPFEVLGTSGYDYYHFDDLEKVVSCHEELMQKGEVTSCYYRFLTKGQQWIWLQTRYYITYHQWNSKPEFVVCTHHVVSYADITKTTKEKDTKDNVSEVNNVTVKQSPSEDALNNMSPSHMSDASDAFASSYRTHSSVDSNRRAEKDAPSEEANTAPLSPFYLSEASDTYAFPSQTRTKRQKVTEGGHSDDMVLAPLSPSYMSEGSDTYGNSYRTHSQQSLKSTSSTADASWRRFRHRYNAASDDSASGDSRSSVRTAMGEQAHKGPEAVAPQHGIGAQYLDPVPYVSAVAVPAVMPLQLRPVPPMPLRAMPVIVAQQDHAQIQEQLQRKHEELQQMIVRQQEELQKVKEQLLLARLGILQPVINVPYTHQEQLQQQQQVNPIQPQITYEGGARAGVAYPLPQPQHPPLPQPPPGPHRRNMPQ